MLNLLGYNDLLSKMNFESVQFDYKDFKIGSLCTKRNLSLDFVMASQDVSYHKM